jgi:hypothetical protein
VRPPGPVGQSVPLLQKVNPQHPLQPNRRPAALALRIVRPQTFNQPPPRHHPLHLGQKLVPPRLLLLAGVFCLRKTALLLHCPAHRSPQTGRFYPMPAPEAGFFSVSLTESRCKAVEHAARKQPPKRATRGHPIGSAHTLKYGQKFNRCWRDPNRSVYNGPNMGDLPSAHLIRKLVPRWATA